MVTNVEIKNTDIAIGSYAQKTLVFTAGVYD